MNEKPIQSNHPLKDFAKQKAIYKNTRSVLAQANLRFAPNLSSLKGMEANNQVIVRLDFPVVFAPGMNDEDFIRIEEALSQSFANAKAIVSLMKKRYEVANAVQTYLYNSQDLMQIPTLADKNNYPEAVMKFLRHALPAYGFNIDNADLADYLNQSLIKNNMQTIFDLTHSGNQDIILVPLSLQCYMAGEDEVIDHYEIARKMESVTGAGVIGAAVLRGDLAEEPSLSEYLQASEPLLAQRHPEIFRLLGGGTLLNKHDQVSIINQFIFTLRNLQVNENITVGNLMTTTQLIDNTASRFSPARIGKIIHLSNPSQIKKSTETMYLIQLNYDIQSLQAFLSDALVNSRDITLAEIENLKIMLNWYVNEIHGKIATDLTRRETSDAAEAVKNSLFAFASWARGIQ